MLSIIKTISSEFDSLNRRLVKFLRMGRSDVQNCYEVAPYGTDANPVKDMVAIYAPTLTKGQPVVIGYINKNQIAEVGEHRIYSTNSSGELQAEVWLKNNGDIHINGSDDNAVRYSPLSAELSAFKDAINQELIKIQTGIVGAGSAYTPTPLDIDISQAKIEGVKTS